MLKELKAVKPGYAFNLEKGLEKPVSIRANGKIVGHGELVSIDNRIGVRIIDFFEASDVQSG
jgi:type III secretion protein Q